MTEKEYRAIPVDSFSTLKDFVKDRKKYYRKYVLGETIREKEVDGMIVGSIVDCLLLTPDEFDSKFAMSKYNAPSGQMGLFVEALYNFTLQSIDSETGEVTRDFKDLLKDAYDTVGFKRDKFETVVAKFNDTPEINGYYAELRNSTTKEVVTPEDYENAERVLVELRSNEVTAEVVNMESSKYISVYSQLQLEMEYRGLPVKMMLDKVIVNHRTLRIQPYDLKVTWNVELFPTEFFVKKYSYLQSALYTIGLTHWQMENYPGYFIEDFRFIVADSINYYNPLIYRVSPLEDHYLNGFEFRKVHYPGLHNVIDDVKWHKENQLWTVSRENNYKKGLIDLTINFD